MPNKEIFELNQGDLLSPKKFVNDNFDNFRKDIRRSIIKDLCSYGDHSWERPWSKQFKREIIKVYSALENFEPQPLDNKPIFVYKRNLHIGSALSKYIKGCVFGPGFGHEDFDVNKYSRTFLIAYKLLGYKDGPKMAAIIEERRNYDLVDNAYWEAVSKVIMETDEKASFNFAKLLYQLKDRVNWNEFSKRKFSFNVNELVRYYVDTYKLGNIKALNSFVCSIKEQSWEVESIDLRGLNRMTRNIVTKIDDPFIFWSVLIASKLQNADFDYTGWDLIGDVEFLKRKNQKDSVIRSYLYGLSKGLNNRKEMLQSIDISDYYTELAADLQTIDYEHLERAREELKNITNSDERKSTMRFIKYEEGLIKNYSYLVRFPDIFNEHKRKIIPSYNPLIFREGFLNVLSKLGPKASMLYANIFASEVQIDIEGRISTDFTVLPERLKEFNNCVGDKIFSLSCYLLPRITKMYWIYRSLIDGIEKCYKKYGEKETIKRIKYTYTTKKYGNSVSHLMKPKNKK